MYLHKEDFTEKNPKASPKNKKQPNKKECM